MSSRVVVRKTFEEVSEGDISLKFVLPLGGGPHYLEIEDGDEGLLLPQWVIEEVAAYAQRHGLASPPAAPQAAGGPGGALATPATSVYVPPKEAFLTWS